MDKRRSIFGMRLWKRDQKGLAALEMVLIFPIIVIFILFTMDAGLFFFDYVSASNSLREGARCGTVGYHDAAVEQRVVDTAGFSDPTTVTVTRAGGLVGDDITVEAEFDHQWLLPVTVISAPTSFTRSVTMRQETPGIDPDKVGLSCVTGVVP